MLFDEFFLAAAVRVFLKLLQFWVGIVVVVVWIDAHAHSTCCSPNLSLFQPQIQLGGEPVPVGPVRYVLGPGHFHDVLDLFGVGHGVGRVAGGIFAGSILAGIRVGIVADRLGPNVVGLEGSRC